MGSAIKATVFLMLLGKSLASAGAVIPDSFIAIAQYTGVPPKILYAVALRESQRGGLESPAPWPWTLNISGAPHYFNNRADMYKALMDALKDGITNVDIGPMQTNWFWKFEQIASPWIITDPTYNTKLGGQILAEHFRLHGDWWVAVGKYHRESEKPVHKLAAQKYLDGVKKIWSTL